MRLPEFKERITEAVITERERCARIADKHGSRVVADEIRSARPPAYHIIRPETADKHPERVTPETIIGGASYAGLD